MYDGMSCGHLALDKLGATVLRYYATEIDKYAIKTTQSNFPAVHQLDGVLLALYRDLAVPDFVDGPVQRPAILIILESPMPAGHLL